jgi:hypothetical protein
LLVFTFSAFPQNVININGKVTGPTGTGIGGATVALLGRSVSTITDSKGQYSLSVVSTINAGIFNRGSASRILLNNGAISFDVLTNNTFVKIEFFTTSGKKVCGTPLKRYNAGNFRVRLSDHNLTAQFLLMRLQIGDKCEMYKVPAVTDFSKSVTMNLQPAGSNTRLEKMDGGAVDTLKVTANGYINRKMVVDNIVSTINVVLKNQLSDTQLVYAAYTPVAKDRVISRTDYINRLHGFWLGEDLANWTGLVTEMDRVGVPRTAAFYTDQNWDGPDFPSMWGAPGPSSTIEFVFSYDETPWGSDDDTDMEYLYQHLLDQHNTSILTAEQIRDGWLEHIYDQNQVTPYGKDDDPNGRYQNYLWVSNQRAFDLMRDEDMIPPNTGLSVNNQYYAMIDAQLTTEIFGFFAPGRPDIALKMASLPIRTTASAEAEQIAQFYVTMYSLAAYASYAPELKDKSMKEKVLWLAQQAYAKVPSTSYVAKMYDFVKAEYDANPDKNDWESTRDAVYQRYQGDNNSVPSADGYTYSGHGNPQANTGPFDAGINFAASLVSLFYGQGDLPRTVQIGALCGWDSDNPTATWGGLLGFMLGKDGVGKAFDIANFSETYRISRTRKNFPDRTPGVDGEDAFPLMAERGVYIIDRVVQEEMHGGIDRAEDVWYIPAN